ncbi:MULTISPECIES: hypothetical protein [Bacillus]|uniref:hypothetical protein n=1 Tax=Bacillus TaxID=1386 RepID=UPI0012B69268|nr:MULTISPECIES: hypothetical protein [Bacillus]
MASIPDKFVGIRNIMEEKVKVSRPIVTPKAQAWIKNQLFTSLLTDEEGTA